MKYWDYLALQEMLNQYPTSELERICHWNDNYNMPEAFEDASREVLERFIIESLDTAESLTELMDTWEKVKK